MMKTSTVVITLGLFIVAAIAYFAWVGSQLAARLTQPDVSGTAYKLLIEYELGGGGYCYDDASDYCRAHAARIGWAANKTGQLAFVFTQPPKGIESAEVYGCFDTENVENYRLTTDNRACVGDARLPLGYVAKEAKFDQAVPLYNCLVHKRIVTDRADCGGAQLVGYGLAAPGRIESKLIGLCDIARTHSPLTEAVKKYCPTQSDSSTPPPQDSPADEPPSGWQNPDNRFDVNDDDAVSPIDALHVINAVNQGGERDLPSLTGGAECVCPEVHAPVCGEDGRTYGNDCRLACGKTEKAHEGECTEEEKAKAENPPPYLDVNGDKRLTRDDAQAVLNHLSGR